MNSIIQFVIKYKYLFIIAAISFLVRFIKLETLPFNFMEDEILVGYVGRYILENGSDIYGNKWPLLYFNKFGDYYIIGPMYLSAFATFIFGVNEFAVRFPVAFFGSLIVFPVYIFSNWIFKNKTIGLISAFLIAILPWHIVLSRSSVEGVLGSTVFLTAIVTIIYAIKKNSVNHVILASILFFITYWIYHPFRMYVPIVFVPLFVLFPSIRKQRTIFMAICVAMIFFFGLTFYISTTEWGKGRLSQTSIFSPISGVERKVQEQIYASGEGHVFETRVFNNKAIGYGREFVRQYLSYFSPSFLFFNSTESRYDMPDQGLLYFAFIILFIAALLPIGKKIQVDSQLFYFLLFLIILAPLPSAITYIGSPNIHRSVLLGILLTIPASVGLYKLITLQYGKFIFIGLALVLFAEFAYFWHQYSVQADVYNAIRRNDGFRELAQYIHTNRNVYDEIYVPSEGNTGLYYLFFSNNFDTENMKEFKDDARINKVDNIHFLDVSCPSTQVPPSTKSVLIVNRHQCDTGNGYKEIGSIKGRNSLLGFKLYSN